MLLISLELENVRSYRRARITFPKGRVLLSGDIGSGKSTILFAIEFALFGLVRGWNDGEKLVRHGSSRARVRLEADIDGVIVIERSLKRAGSSIQQEEVLVIEDGIERRITPSEARSLIVARLGYPEEFTTKQPLLFRYTIFTPQESMKQIIEERAEARLAAVRTIFGIDRYESVSRNAQIVARALKQKSALLTGRLERKRAVIEELAQNKRSERELVLERDAAKSALEAARAAFEETLVQLETMRSMLEAERAKRTERERLISERNDLEKELESLIAERSGLVIEEVEVPDVAQIEERITTVDGAIATLDSTLEAVREERSELVKQLALKQAEETAIARTIDELEKAQREREPLYLAAKRAMERFARFDAQAVGLEIEKIKTSITEARDERARLEERVRAHSERLESMPEDECPTCGQTVDPKHRESSIALIRASLQQGRARAQRMADRLGELEAKKATLDDRLGAFREAEQQMSALGPDRTDEHEKLTASRSVITSERIRLSERTEGVEQRVESALEQRAGRISERDALRRKLRSAQALRLRSEQAKRSQLRATQIAERSNEVRSRIERISASLPNVDMTVFERFESARNAHDRSDATRSEASARHERLEERMRSLLERLDALRAELTQLKRVEHERSSLESIIGFLSDQVPNLSEHIESAILRRILIETNDRFSSWFSILVEDLEGYLDERFTPRIVQSGYDVSFENLSGGERTSVALAFRLALHESINHITGRSSSGLLILDEPTDGFSSEQLAAVRTVLTELVSEQVIIVSHEAVVEGFVDSVIRIEKLHDESVIS